MKDDGDAVPKPLFPSLKEGNGEQNKNFLTRPARSAVGEKDRIPEGKKAKGFLPFGVFFWSLFLHK